MSQCIHLRKASGTGLLLLLICGMFFACSKPATQKNWAPGDTTTITIQGTALQVELAMTPARQAKGLMKRESLPEDHGMLFIFDYPEQRSFWMKNTWIPLDIAYIDSEGIIKEIHPLYPNNQNSVRSRNKDIQFALETNRDWFKNHNIPAGTAIDLSHVLPIMRDRGIFCELHKK